MSQAWGEQGHVGVSYNAPAISLYEKMGYSALAMLIDRSAVLMSKEF